MYEINHSYLQTTCMAGNVPIIYTTNEYEWLRG